MTSGFDHGGEQCVSLRQGEVSLEGEHAQAIKTASYIQVSL